MIYFYQFYLILYHTSEPASLIILRGLVLKSVPLIFLLPLTPFELRIFVPFF